MSLRKKGQPVKGMLSSQLPLWVTVIARGEGRLGLGRSGQRHRNGDKKRLCLGIWAHDAVCTQFVIELYT